MSPVVHLRRRLGAAAAVLGSVLALAGCGSPSGSSPAAGQAKDVTHVEGVSSSVNLDQCGKDTRTIKHDLGSTTITGNPVRVVVLELSFVDALADVGLQPAGIADDNNKSVILPQLLDKVGDYTSVGLRPTPNLQVITSLKPDLIIADTSRHKTIYDQLSKIAPTVSFPSLNGTYQQVLDGEMLVAEAVNRCDPMKARLAQHAQVMNQYKQEVPPGESRKALFAIASDNLFSAQTLASFAPGVLKALGLQPVLGDTEDQAVLHMSLESLVAAKPDIMFVADATAKNLTTDWQKTPLWGQLPAVANHAYFVVDRNLWSRSRGILAGEIMAQQVVKDLYGK
jgi:ABC-type Fe3+-citrate transport system substrate-binding protein